MADNDVKAILHLSKYEKERVAVAFLLINIAYPCSLPASHLKNQMDVAKLAVKQSFPVDYVMSDAALTAYAAILLRLNDHLSQEGI